MVEQAGRQGQPCLAEHERVLRVEDAAAGGALAPPAEERLGAGAHGDQAGVHDSRAQDDLLRAVHLPQRVRMERVRREQKGMLGRKGSEGAQVVIDAPVGVEEHHRPAGLIEKALKKGGLQRGDQALGGVHRRPARQLPCVNADVGAGRAFAARRPIQPGSPRRRRPGP